MLDQCRKVAHMCTDIPISTVDVSKYVSSNSQPAFRSVQFLTISIHSLGTNILYCGLIWRLALSIKYSILEFRTR